MSAAIFAAPVSGAHARFMTNLPAKRVPGAMDSVPRRQKTVSRGSKIRCMKTWNPIDNKKFETFSYLPPLSNESLTKQVEYMLQKGWIPCIEFDGRGILHRSNGQMPGYYDGRYFTMWKLPMFGCTDASQVMHEIDECRKAFPSAYVRLIGFDNRRQAQCMGFIIHKPNYLENKT